MNEIQPPRRLLTQNGVSILWGGKPYTKETWYGTPVMHSCVRVIDGDVESALRQLETHEALHGIEPAK
jgi:hypothetical protein